MARAPPGGNQTFKFNDAPEPQKPRFSENKRSQVSRNSPFSNYQGPVEEKPGIRIKPDNPLHQPSMDSPFQAEAVQPKPAGPYTGKKNSSSWSHTESAESLTDYQPPPVGAKGRYAKKKNASQWDPTHHTEPPPSTTSPTDHASTANIGANGETRDIPGLQPRGGLSHRHWSGSRNNPLINNEPAPPTQGGSHGKKRVGVQLSATSQQNPLAQGHSGAVVNINQAPNNGAPLPDSKRQAAKPIPREALTSKDNPFSNAPVDDLPNNSSGKKVFNNRNRSALFGRLDEAPEESQKSGIRVLGKDNTPTHSRIFEDPKVKPKQRQNPTFSGSQDSPFAKNGVTPQVKPRATNTFKSTWGGQ